MDKTTAFYFMADLKSKYGIKFTSEERKDVLKKAKQINELRQSNYIKELRPTSFKPVKALKNIHSRKDLEILKKNMNDIIQREQQQPAYRTQVWKQNIADVALSMGEITQDDYSLILSLTQEQMDLLNRETHGEFGNVHYWYTSKPISEGSTNTNSVNKEIVNNNLNTLYSIISQTGTPKQKALLNANHKLL